MRRWFFFFALCFHLFASDLIAQSDFAVEWLCLDCEEKTLDVDLPARVSDSLSLIGQLRALISTLQSQAYLAASVDTVGSKDSTFRIRLYRGGQYEWARLGVEHIDQSILSGIGFRERLFQDKPFHYLEVIEIQDRILTYLEDNGYPFAEVALTNVLVDSSRIAADLSLTKGPLILIEGVEIKGNANISDYYLENYLGLQPGGLYNKSRLLRTRSRIRELPFLQESRDASVSFKGNKATINLFTDRKKASRWDFLIGILPQNNSLDPSQTERPIITTSILADMHNQLGLGEKIFFQFQQTQPQRQQIQFEFLYPYMLNLPFGADLDFSLFRRDSAFVEVKFDAGVQYLLEGGNYLKAFWKNNTSFLQQVDTSSIIQSGRLPDILDVSTTSLGLEYSFQKLDYRFNPRKGWSVFLRGGVGQKKIKENSLILSIEDARLDPEALYDSLKTENIQYQADILLEYYIPVLKNSTLKTALRGGGLFSSQAIYRNEQYRLGGNRLLRGFDEESINATMYGLLTVEYRLLIGTNSNFYVFGDVAYLEDTTVDVRRFDRPYGFGAGLTFETRVGIFGFSLALGSEQNNPIDLRKVKTHFGYVNFF